MSYQTEETVLTEEILVDQYDLVIYNDDYNTFQHVIETLMEVCKHDQLQAEQCTLLIHYKGKCGVKRGTAQELKPMCEAILTRGISAKVE
ncbi:MAG TPA: ATP-dependent Clp protease adaptor ClpS [Bacteroidia bacterium]|jgi:ATP-dependent Clp protease adaptor protein ClpS|nr:ATP-dependent Clp protease adaptor ClpS [Bacteroidia bacterium]